MMAGSPDIDRIGIQDSYMTISAAMLLRSGALLDFNQFEELTALKEYYRDIFGMVTISGHWYAAPVDGIDMHLWQVNPRLARELGWEIPEGRWTWDDFRALTERIKAYNETAEKPMYLLQDDSYALPYFLMEYQANHIDAYASAALYCVPVLMLYGLVAMILARPRQQENLHSALAMEVPYFRFLYRMYSLFLAGRVAISSAFF